MPVEMSVEVVVVLKQIHQSILTRIVPNHLEINLNKILIRLQNELLQSVLDLAQVVEVLETELNQLIWVVYLLALVEDVESFEILALLVAFYLFADFLAG